MEKETLVYQEFLDHYEHANIYEEKYYALLISSDYEPNKDQTLEEILKYEIWDPNYTSGGQEITIKKVSEEAAAVDGAYIHWDALSPKKKEDKQTPTDIRYLVVYSEDFYKRITLVMCQDFQENISIVNDNLKITWNKFFLQFIPTFESNFDSSAGEEENDPNNPDNVSDYNAILNECILGWMKLGYNHDGYEENWKWKYK